MLVEASGSVAASTAARAYHKGQGGPAVLKKRRSLLGALVLSLAVAAQAFAASFAAAAPGEVLILEPTVSGGASSTLAQKFALAGKTPVLVSPALRSSWG